MRMTPVSWRWLLIVTALGLVAAFYFSDLRRSLSWDHVRGNLDTVQAWVDEHPALASTGFVGLYVLVTALSLPVANVLSILCGAVFGRWFGTALVLPAAAAGASLAMLGSRYLFRDFVRLHFGPRLEAIDRGVERDGAYYLLSLRLLPVVPFWLINLGMGLTSLSVATFFWVSFVGMLPGTFVYVNAGTALATLESPRDILSPTVLVSLALLGLMPLVARRLIPRRGSAATCEE